MENRRPPAVLVAGQREIVPVARHADHNQADPAGASEGILLRRSDTGPLRLAFRVVVMAWAFDGSAQDGLGIRAARQGCHGAGEPQYDQPPHGARSRARGARLLTSPRAARSGRAGR